LALITTRLICLPLFIHSIHSTSVYGVQFSVAQGRGYHSGQSGHGLTNISVKI